MAELLLFLHEQGETSPEKKSKILALHFTPEMTGQPPSANQRAASVLTKKQQEFSHQQAKKQTLAAL